MEEEIAQLKSVLRSLVVSSPTQVDVRSLMRDYRNMIGSAVPLRKYGYNNPVEFFKERFSDCFLFGGATSNPVLTLIVPETLKHIDKFVQKQRSSNTNKFNPKRRSVPEQLVLTNQEKSLSKIKNRNHISSLPIELSKATHEKSSSPKNRRPTESHVPASKPSVPPTHTESCLSIPTSLTSPSKPNTSCKKHNRKIPIKSVNNVYNTFQTKHNGDINVANGHEDLESKEETDSKTEDIPVSSTDAVKKFLKKRLPMYKSEQHLDEESTEECSKTIPDGASGLYTSSSGSSAKAQQLERLKEEIMVLITDAPDGVWCTDLLPLYRERYNRELNFTRFGYTSILSLVYCLEQQVEITRPEDMGDWLVRERGRAAPPTSPRPRPRPRRPAPPLASPAPRPHHDDDDALPGIDFDPDVFPEDCMHFMESIELTSMSDFQPGAMVEVMVGEVYSPSHFWLIRLGENYNIAMEDMMDEMTQYYGGAGGGAGRVLARGAVRVGHYCASLYERDWHRSLIVKLIDSDTVKVRHIDYGTVDTLGVGALKPLRRCWAALPAQASRARLGGVRPCAGAPRWPHAAATAFLALVSDRRLVANVVAQEPAARLAEVLLIDTAGERDVSLGAELVRAGHADARSDSALHTLEVYQFPRFEALESGATPNYAEVHAYLRDGIALDYVPAYRDHVPQPLARQPYDPPDLHPLHPLEPCAGVSPDESRSTEDASDHSPSPSSETCTSTDVTESTANSDLPLRIPLLLPDAVSPPRADSPQSKTQVAAELSPPPRSAEPSCPAGWAERPSSPGERPCPLPTSHLSPYAPPYVPGGPFRPTGSAYPAPYGCSPLPQYAGPTTPMPPPGVTLSLDECETYRALSHVNPAAAHWFIVGAMGRATAVPPFVPPPCLRPLPPPPPPPLGYLQPRLGVHPPVRIRPPPGFRSF